MHPVAPEKSPGWLRKLGQQSRPGRVVNICFCVVLLFSTLLTWRETVVLEEAYIANQRNNLENVVREMDAQLQFNVDRLLFFRNGMQAALQTPLAIAVLRDSEKEFSRKRHLPDWHIVLDNRRTLPLNGVSDAFVEQTHFLSRDNPLLGNEFTAAMELGYLLRLSSITGHHLSRFSPRMLYVSRAGFFLSNEPVTKNITEQYYGLVTSPWFTQQSERSNPGRGVRWYTTFSDDKQHEAQQVTASVSLNAQNYWFGVLATQLSVSDMGAFLLHAVEGETEGEYQLYDSRMNLIASSEKQVVPLSPQLQAQLANAYEKDNNGSLREMTRYISWEKLRNFDGVLLRIHSLNEGLRGDFGRISIALTLLWVLFTGMLILSWVVIRQMVSNMYTLQESLQWRAWYDALTRLYNRGALFERAATASALCRQEGKPLAVLQLDLDHFKSINDHYGHQAGDRVLAHIARLIANKIREGDIAGRVGGEEFCVVLPNATLAHAREIAERIRESINSREILVSKGQTIRVSASVGVSASNEHHRYDFAHLQSVADRRLYLAKEAGRNQVRAED
ncbi:cellulose biosynthesis regulator diguanylate cyclase DgcQ [Pseudocitrobacter sp. Cyp-38S]|uniref:diguanylate cyclase n=1 Tax=Pseudocitrobacter cyperus TaxID=3112843 RepID=A0ABV0HLF4_9ENTR